MSAIPPSSASNEINSGNSCVVVSARRLALTHEVDLVVVGGTVAAVAAATVAAAAGRRVLLASPYPYLGEEFCATLQLQRPEVVLESDLLTQAIFADANSVTPLHVKQVLTKAVVGAGVKVLLNTFPVGILEGESGMVRGLILADRSGRHAVAAKHIVDATRHHLVSQVVTGKYVAPANGMVRASRVVLSGADSTVHFEPTTGPAAGGGPGQGVRADVCRFEVALSDASPAGWAALEQLGRARAWVPGQLRAAASLGYELPLAGPASLANVAALGWTAGESAGRAAGRDAVGSAAAVTLRVGGESVKQVPAAAGALDLAEPRKPLFAAASCHGEVEMPATVLPVLATVDVLVCGGGTAGAAAAIAAARDGARVLVVEAQEALGGVGTIGLIGRAYHGRRVGFAAEVPFPDAAATSLEDKIEWLRRAVTDAGGQIWFGAVTTGAIVGSAGLVCGAAVATQWGHGAVLAKVVIDGTGNADVAAAAGAATISSADANDIAVQGTGLATRPLTGSNISNVNSDCLLVEDGNVLDETRAFLGRTLALNAEHDYDLLPFIQSRERRRIVAEHMLDYLDQLLGRTYPDTIVHSQSDYDAHGYPSLPYFALLPHDATTRQQNHPAPHAACDTPYRTLLPCGLDGLLVVGLGCGMHRDASALVRMQLDLLNQGYAAGLAAAQAVRQQVPLRQLDVRALQRRLVESGALPERVLSDRDNLAELQAQVARAAADFTDLELGYAARSAALAVLMRFPDAAQDVVRKLFNKGQSEEQRLEYAKLLGFAGHADGVDLLIAALQQCSFDAKIYQGRMAEYAHLPTPVDALILALGYSGARHAVPVLLAKLAELDADVTLSHHRAIALALEHLGDRRAAAPLAELLQKPGMGGHVLTALVPLVDKPVNERRREGALREIVLARALWRCGDCQGYARRILESYCDDCRGLLARHAAAVLRRPA